MCERVGGALTPVPFSDLVQPIVGISTAWLFLSLYRPGPGLVWLEKKKVLAGCCRCCSDMEHGVWLGTMALLDWVGNLLFFSQPPCEDV